MKGKKNFVPKAKVAAGSVQELINEMREGNGGRENTIPSTNQTETENLQSSVSEGKKSIVPKGVLAVDPEIQRMRDLLTSGREVAIDSDGTISAIGGDKDLAEKAHKVPKGILAGTY